MRRAIPASEAVTKGVITASPVLDGSGKAPSASLGASGILEDDKKATKDAEPDEEEEQESEVTKHFVPVLKLVDDEQIVTGVVLQPEEIDAHGDIYDATVIRQACHGFMAKYKGPVGSSSKSAKLGVMHKEFKPQFIIFENYLAPQDVIINGRTIKAGSWIMTVKVLDDSIWKLVKAGKLTGFSIGGKARVKKLAA